MMRVWAAPPGACEDATQPETTDDAESSQIASVEGHRYRERPIGVLYATSYPKVGIAGKTSSEARTKELVENIPDLAELVEPPARCPAELRAGVC